MERADRQGQRHGEDGEFVPEDNALLELRFDAGQYVTAKIDVRAVRNPTVAPTIVFSA